ncbi:hypothetical protein [Variovorax ginsengisoli]|uniref:Uncharacterized protein n=1 Tax=Variovorax ginsengisoli TaxID=363844 RepID=A0ABT8SCD7_9BURK|nr:hypothetical protein [Variovorax ginsengisoli]MDM0080334.1 hypothetical protein [Variovorax sp. J31P179]MDN8615931.1 hypothetical protein [Variovorax ginsengisoli]MDO1535101.1 hypothetical protein [Variovorax ginsengisoli]HET7837896.1 hypothetical protein [Variovorax sp.]
MNAMLDPTMAAASTQGREAGGQSAASQPCRIRLSSPGGFPICGIAKV